MTGDFASGEVVGINRIAKAVVNFSSVELKAIAGKHTTEVKKILGEGHRDVVAIPEDIVFLDF